MVFYGILVRATQPDSVFLIEQPIAMKKKLKDAERRQRKLPQIEYVSNQTKPQIFRRHLIQ